MADVTRLEDNGNLCRVRVHKLFCASQLKIGDEIDVDITSLIFGPKPFETGTMLEFSRIRLILQMGSSRQKNKMIYSK